MKSTKSAIRYAKALMDLSIENDNLEDVSSNMKRVVESSNETPDFKIFLNSPVIKTDKKIAIMKILFVGFEELSLSFIELITKNKRENLLVEIADSFLFLLKKHQNIVPVSIKSARKLEKETLDQILNKLKSNVDGDIEVTEEIDKSLIGGFIIRMDDKQIDASVLNQLKRMKQELAN